jgi:hypothetical protein
MGVGEKGNAGLGQASRERESHPAGGWSSQSRASGAFKQRLAVAISGPPLADWTSVLSSGGRRGPGIGAISLNLLLPPLGRLCLLLMH